MQCPKLNGIFSLTVVSPSESQGEAAAAAVSPEDLLATAVAENKAALEGELLKRALALDPRGFELLVLRLLAELMLRHGVGVQAKTSVTLYDLDEDFFEEL